LNLNKPINNLSQRLSKLHSDTSIDTNHDDGIKYWRGKKIISLNQWLQTKKDHTLEAALHFFPDGHPGYGLHYILDNIGDPKLKEDTDKWYSEYEDLMENRRNPIYGRKKCSRCLLSPDREQARIFLGINKIIANALERRQDVSSLSPSAYPCPILNIFECPYATKKQDNQVCGKETETTSTIIDVNDLFELSEIAFQLELALTKAQVITKSNDTIYETNFDTGKVKELCNVGNPVYLSTMSIEEKLAGVKRLSKVPIRNTDDIYRALTDRDTLDKVLDQGLDEEYQKYKDDIVDFFMIIKDRIQKEDLFNALNSDASCNDNKLRQRQQYAKCSTCQEFANIHCINCYDNNIWLCLDHWEQHRADKHSSDRIL
jgi:hypothetical protein